MRKPCAVFALNLLQDVNIVRPLLLIAAGELGLDTHILVSRKFVLSDPAGIWLREIEEVGWRHSLRLHYFGSAADALQVLGDKHGVLICASESDLPPHAETHGLFLSAPPGFVRITLQHGMEGVGFLHSREHDRAHGTRVGFAADILCGWFGAKFQKSMLPSQRPKLFVAGPTTALHERPEGAEAGIPPGTGLVCENLHSVRFTANEGAAGDFVQHFNLFCSAQGEKGRRVALRPHPAGQYMVRNKIPLPENADLANAPVYKTGLGGYAYGISAASSVLIDMILAGLPVAVWRDRDSAMDIDVYAGLATVSTPEEWIAFVDAAIADPAPFRERQQALLAHYGIPEDRTEIARRFASVISASAAISQAPAEAPRAPQRIVLVGEVGGELDDVFRATLDADPTSIDIAFHTLPASEAARAIGGRAPRPAAKAWVNARLESIRPTMIVFHGRQRPYQDVVLEYALRHGLPVVQFLGCAHAESAEMIEGEMEQVFLAADLVCGSIHNLEAIRARLDETGKPAIEMTAWTPFDVRPVSRSAWTPRADLQRQVRTVLSRARNVPRRTRVLLVCPSYLPTLQLSFIKPFATPAARRDIVYKLITAEEMAALPVDKMPGGDQRHWIAEQFRAFSPDVVILCRYAGPHTDLFLDLAREAGIPSIYHIDDDLLNVPVALGKAKAQIHNAPERVGAVRKGLDEADLVYASTARLRNRLIELGVRAPIRAGEIYCPGTIVSPAELRPVRRFGYMASADHAHNLAMILPAVIEFLRRNEDVEFELFGSIPRPAELAEFGNRVRGSKPIRNYEEFLQHFADRQWDVGICPLVPIGFNLAKADTKLIEYTSIGAAVVASRDTTYDHFAGDGSCLLANGNEEWLAALD